MTPASGWARPPRCSASPSRRSVAGRHEGRMQMDPIGRRPAPGRRSRRSPGSSPSGGARPTDRPIVAQSARNRFPGIVTRIEKDRVAAVVEIHRRAASARQPDDRRGRRRARRSQSATRPSCVVKATNVIVEIPSAEESPRVNAVRAGQSWSSSPSRARAACSAARTAPSAASATRPRDRIDGPAPPPARSSPSSAPRRSRARSTRRRPPRRPRTRASTLTISTDSSARSRPRSSRARRPTSSCRPTRRTRRSSSTSGLATARRSTSPATC